MRDVARYFLAAPRVSTTVAIDACARLSDCLTFFADQFDATGIPFTPIHLTVGLSYGIRNQVRYLKCINRVPILQEFVDELVIFRERQLPLEIDAFSDYFSFRLIIAPTRAALFDLFVDREYATELKKRTHEEPIQYFEGFTGHNSSGYFCSFVQCNPATRMKM